MIKSLKCGGNVKFMNKTQKICDEFFENKCSISNPTIVKYFESIKH